MGSGRAILCGASRLLPARTFRGDAVEDALAGLGAHAPEPVAGPGAVGHPGEGVETRCVRRSTVPRVDIDLPAEDDPRRLEIRALAGASTRTRRRPIWSTRARGPALARAVGARRRARAAADHRRRAEAGRRRQADEPDRHRALRAGARRARHRRAEGALPPADAARRGDVVPAVQRARGRLRPGQPVAPGRCATATCSS